MRITLGQLGDGLLVPGHRLAWFARLRRHARQREQWLRAQLIELCRPFVSHLRPVELPRLAQQMAEQQLAGEVVIGAVFLDELARPSLIEIQLPEPIQRGPFRGIRCKHLLVTLDDLVRRRLPVERRGDNQ